MEHPFAVRSWSREDMAGMFRLLRHLGFNHVMVWPTPETAPMPLSDEDAATLRSYRGVIDDAHAAGLKLWLAYCPTVISTDAVRGLPWADRSLYATTREVRLTDAATEQAYLKHRSAVLRLLDNADAFVVIDGDPGGYAGAPMEEYLRILASDQRAVPGKPIIPMIWTGWGRETKGGFWQAPVAPLVEKCYAALQETMSGDWEILPGRSHREGWANGRTTIALAEKAGLMSRATLMCYEAIEFEPTPPAAVLQFDLIRNALRQESQYAGVAKGVFGNSQQPVMVLPNLYYFARAAADLRYLDRAQDDVLADLARELGGDPAVLVPAWSCLPAGKALRRSRRKSAGAEARHRFCPLHPRRTAAICRNYRGPSAVEAATSSGHGTTAWDRRGSCGQPCRWRCGVDPLVAGASLRRPRQEGRSVRLAIPASGASGHLESARRTLPEVRFRALRSCRSKNRG
jgi:hypothetical protein